MTGDDRPTTEGPDVFWSLAPDRRRALGLAAVALLLLLFSAVLLRPQSGDPAPAPAPAPPPASTSTATAIQSATSDAATGAGGLAAPTATAVAKAGSVEFTWTYPEPRSDDTFRVHVGPTAAAAQIADPVTVTKATYTVRVPGGSAICLVATVLRSGQASPASPVACGTAL